ncbi:protein containing YCII-related domain protein [Flexivirga endophytica]|uniref:Protein containing YCII-related domain protein n=1 Tax=Flexivirga endophytica TaxID=1849103 RepID=A0A916SZ90_9MICO|nr:YciI family protein [Flexivirga endophytica]GGB23135.1 protein containing YCII-related domain protein [Flexivirga endophytica]GHB57057.1 protein containing YCII-related domain protein [Flexivirga endophytica]
MKYFLTHVIEPDGSWPEDTEQRLDDWVAEMDHRGVLLAGAPLRSDVAPTAVRRTDTTVSVSDGPFAETKEQVAGFDLIEAADLDEAIAVAGAHPTLGNGAIEIRPVIPGMPTPVPREPRADRERYLMLVCWDQTGDAEITEQGRPGDEPRPMDDWIAYAGERRLHGWQLQPPAFATTVRRVDGAVAITDGPFAETKEQIGGYDLLEVTDLDEAVAIATAHGSDLIDLRRCAAEVPSQVGDGAATA